MRRLTVIPVLASVLLLAACGGGSSDDPANALADPAAAAGGADFTAYRDCLSQNGVDLPEGGQGGFPGGGQRPSGMPTDMPSGFPTDRPSGAPTDVPSGAPSGFPSGGPGQGGGGGGMRMPDGVDQDTWQAAQEACSSLAPTRPNGGPGAGTGSTESPSAAAPQYAVFWRCMADHDVTAPASGLPDDLDTSEASVKAALDTCDALLPES